MNDEKSKRRRSWQFGLRTLLLLMFGTAFFFGGWSANEWKRERELRQAAKNAAGLYFLPDDVQYFAPGPEARLTREAPQ